ncbi:hypothetical protein [Flavobacterium soli]|uniref:hypothetical protein n=1 Tax=Flavobacterium soli TaxID=344881 RepID=UPI0004064B23|nr:hypothetical protein [Flavobacterium soli]
MSQAALNRDRLSCIVLLASVVLYFSQEIILPFAAVGQILLVVIYGISFLYLIKMILSKEKFHKIMKIWVVFLIMNLFGYLFSSNYSEFEILKAVLLNFLPFFPFYYFAKKNILTTKYIVGVFFVLLPIFILKFQRSVQTLKLEKFNDDYVDNTVYFFIGLLPFVFFIKNKIVAFLSLMAIWFFMVQSSKRGAILAGIIAIILYFIHNLYTADSKTKFRTYIMSFLLIVGVSLFGYRIYMENEFLITRMNDMLEGDTTGRDSIASNAFQAWYQSDNIFTTLFGLGYNSIKSITGHVSHNDWVDMLTSYGIFGLFLYSLIYFIFMKEIMKKDWMVDKKIILILFFFIAFITSMTSRWYWSNFAYTQMIILPYILATKNKRN